MLRHVVLFRWSDASTSEQRAAAIDGLRRLPSVVPSIRAYSVGPDAGLADGNWDLAVTGDFDDTDGWRAYLDHPEHVDVADTHLRPFLAARAAVQMELPG